VVNDLAVSHIYAYILIIMRTTIDLPDELFRRAKAEAALRGRKLRDFVEEALRRALDEQDGDGLPKPPKTLHEAMREVCGMVEGGPSDYSTNPDYLNGFGR
jgi:Arc/MetJ family transcription regulator